MREEPRKALVVRGGWEGHRPVETTELFISDLEAEGFDLRIAESTEVYAEPGALDGLDLIVQCVSMGEISGEGLRALLDAVAGGTGFAGWHGGVLDSPILP